MIMRQGRIEQIGTPEEIYYHPTTLFTASFVSKCNLVKGTWSGDSFYAAAGSDAGVAFGHGPVELCFRRAGVYPVRPEELALSHTGTGLRGRILNRQWGGREISYKVDCDGEVLTAYGSLQEHYKEGEQVVLRHKETAYEIAI